MAIQNFDQLNSISTKWYSKMQIPQKKQKERVDLSLLFGEIFGLFFDLIDDYKLRDVNDLEDLLCDWLEERLKIVASNFIGTDDLAYVNDWSKTEAEKIVDITLNHTGEEPKEVLEEDIENEGRETSEQEEKKPKEITFEEFDVSIPEEDYWISDLRAILLGIECASSVANFYELYDALNQGMTNKVWITEADDKVRPTHNEVDHVDIPIRDLFIVGNSHLLFPGDVQNGAEEQEVYGCRCHCEYYKK